MPTTHIQLREMGIQHGEMPSANSLHGLQDALGRSALMFAAGNCAEAALLALLGAGATLGLRDRRSRSVLDYAPEDTKVKQLLLDRYAGTAWHCLLSPTPTTVQQTCVLALSLIRSVKYRYSFPLVQHVHMSSDRY